MAKIIFYEDPSHGWAKVKRSALKALGILDKITHFSYQYGEWVYLEEDCDLTTYIRAMRKKDPAWELSLIHKVNNRQSQIRNYKPFCLLEGEQVNLQVC